MKTHLCMIALLLLLACFPGRSHAADWTEWQQLKDKAYDGLSFSYRTDCGYGATGACNYWWGFKNGYRDAVDIRYTISYQAADGGTVKHTSTARLKPGVNELPEFRLSGRKLLAVDAELLLEKRERNKVDAELARKEREQRQKEETARREQKRQQRIADAAALPYQPGEPKEVTDYRESQRQLAQMQEENNRRYEEDLRRIEEEGRQRQEEAEEQRRQRESEREEQRRESDRRQEEDLARIKREGAERDEFNRRLADQSRELGNTIGQSINNYYQIKQDGDEAVRRAQREAEQRQREAERREREQQGREQQQYQNPNYGTSNITHNCTWGWCSVAKRCMRGRIDACE